MSGKSKTKPGVYATKVLLKQLFKIRKKNEILAGWTPMMLNAVNTMRSVGHKYASNIRELQGLTAKFPRTLARIGSGIGQDKIKMFKDTEGEWYIPIKLFNKKTKITKESYKLLLTLNKSTIILYLHGGAMCLCSNKTHREMLLRLSYSTNMPILAVNYRKPPDYPFPAPQNDCYNAYMYLINEGFSVILAGDSAGGNLALNTTKMLINKKMKLPKNIILISPWVDLTENASNITSESSIINNSKIDFLPIEGISVFAKNCIKNHESLNNNEIMESLKKYSPNYYDLTGFPGIYMFTGEYEMLIDQQRKFVNQAKKYKVDIKYFEESNMVHAYPLFASLGVKGAKNFFERIKEIFKAVDDNDLPH